MKSALQVAIEAWNVLPMHKKMLVSDVVVPLLAALADLQRQIDQLRGAKNGES